jgi:hypothetical protein
MLLAGDRENPGYPQGEDKHPKNGTGGGSQLVKAGQEGKGSPEDSHCRNSLLHRLVGGPWHA